MTSDRRFLFEGSYERAVDKVFDIGPTPSRLVAAGLGTVAVRLQVLAGGNTRRADEQHWAQFNDPSGNFVFLSSEFSYRLLIQPGTYRLNPVDMRGLDANARIWLEDATYRGTDRIMFNTDVYGASAAAGSVQTDPSGTVGGGAEVELAPDAIELPPLADGVSRVTVQFAHDSENTCLLYGFGASGKVRFSCGDVLFLSADEYQQLRIELPWGSVSLAVFEGS